MVEVIYIVYVDRNLYIELILFSFMVVKKFVDYFKSKKEIIKSHMFTNKDKYVCRLCHEILNESDMSENDPSVCNDCSKRE